MKNFCIVINEESYGKIESGSKVENTRLAQPCANVAEDLYGILDRIYGINTMKTISGRFDNLVYPINPV
jgi:hypothetical protein